MNQLACVYCHTVFELGALITSDAFIEKANKLRLSAYFPFENYDIERQVLDLINRPTEFDAEFLKLTGVIKVHECVVPFLVQKIILPDPPPVTRPFIMAEPQLFWLEDIDVWYNFPETWVRFLKPVTPQAIFDSLNGSSHEF